MPDCDSTGLYPDAEHYQSTEKAVRLSTRLMGDNELAGGVLEPVMLPESSGAPSCCTNRSSTMPWTA